jgi:glycosyltransferase involved in cell wall biosynthesis
VSEVHFVVPDGIDDPARPSGGNTYDRHLRDGLGAGGWTVRERAVAGFWDGPDGAAYAGLEASVREIPDDAVVLVDGLIASTAPEVLVPQARRLGLVVLMHMPLGHEAGGGEARERERAVLRAAAATVTTSAWTRGRLIELYGLAADRVRVAEPGVEPAEPAGGPGVDEATGRGEVSGSGEALLCVGTVSFAKGQDLLLEALGSIAGLSWRCACVGRLDRDPAFVEALRRRTADMGLDGRVSFPGPSTGADLDRAYASAELMVTASRAETYGLVVTEALARGLPVLAADVGGVAEALGEGADGVRPGLLVAPEDPVALAAALLSWLTDADLRARLRRAAAERRDTIRRWSDTAATVAATLAEVAA